jgi:PAS domain S-box-containing protein
MVDFKRSELERLFDLSIDPMCISDKNGYLLKANPAFSRVLGYLPNELKNELFSSIVHPEDKVSFEKSLIRYQAGEKVSRLECRCKTKFGAYKWLSWQLLADIKANNIVAIARDINEFKEASQALAESEKHLNNLINDVFRYQKMGEDQPIISSYIDLYDFLGNIELSLQNNLRARNARLIYDNLPVVYSNEPILFIVVKTLIEKSLTHNGQDTPVLEIRYHQSRQNHYLSIKDNGYRIRENYPIPSIEGLKKIQIDQSFQSDDMALILAQKLIEKLQGQVAFSPASKDTGSIFQIAFPITAELSQIDEPLVINL